MMLFTTSSRISLIINALALARAIKRTSRENLYEKVGFESFQGRRWYRKLCCLYKISKSQAPFYFYNKYQPLIIDIGQEKLMLFLTLISIVNF